MRKELEELLSTLAREHKDIPIDDFAREVGVYGPSPDEIDELMTELEKRGVVVIAPEGGGGEERLRVVLASARALRQSLGRVPTAEEIAQHSGLDVALVRQALALGRVMGQ